MPYQSNSKIITNRQLNFTLGPVDTYNNKVMPHRLANYEIDGTWNHHQSIILDVILDRYFRVVYRDYKKLPQSWRSKHVIKKISAKSQLINPGNIKFMSMPPLEAYQDFVGYDVFSGLNEDYERYKSNNNQQGDCLSFEQYVDRYFDNHREYQYFKKTKEKETSPFCTDFPLNFDLLNLFDNYNVISKYKYNITKHLEKIAQTKFKITYKVKYIEQLPTHNDEGKMTGRGKLSDMYYHMQEFQHLFELSVSGTDAVLNFNTPLGKLVLHNMLILDTDWWPVEAVSLSKNAYFLFKRFVMNRRYGKFKAKRIVLKFEEVKKFLDINWKNDRGVNQIIVKALDDMVQKGLVESFEIDKNRTKQRFYELLFEK